MIRKQYNDVTPGRFGTGLNLALFLLLASCLAYVTQRGWKEFKSNQLARDAITADEQLRSAPPLDVVVNDLLVGEDALFGTESLSLESGQPKLVLFGRESCVKCDAAWNSWAAAFDRHGSSSVETWYVSFRGAAVPTPVKRMINSRPGKVVQIRDELLFAVKSGITVLPVVYAINSVGAVRCVVAGKPSDPDIAECLQRVLDNERGARFYTFSTSLESAFGTGPK